MNFNSLATMGQNNMSMPPINPTKFKQLTSQLTQKDLEQFVQQARTQGIPEEQIQQGLNFIGGLINGT